MFGAASGGLSCTERVLTTAPSLDFLHIKNNVLASAEPLSEPVPLEPSNSALTSRDTLDVTGV